MVGIGPSGTSPINEAKLQASEQDIESLEQEN